MPVQLFLKGCTKNKCTNSKLTFGLVDIGANILYDFLYKRACHWLVTNSNN